MEKERIIFLKKKYGYAVYSSLSFAIDSSQRLEIVGRIRYNEIFEKWHFTPVFLVRFCSDTLQETGKFIEKLNEEVKNEDSRKT